MYVRMYMLERLCIAVPFVHLEGGAVLRMDPLTSIQVAVKNNVKVFYFTCTVPMHALLAEDGKLGK